MFGFDLNINMPGLLNGKNCDELKCQCGTETFVPKRHHAASYTCVKCLIEARDE